MGLMQIVSGAYGLLYRPKGSANFLPIGHTDKDGVSWRVTKHGQQIQTAFTGDTIADQLKTGASVTLHMNLLEAGLANVRRMLFDDTTDGSGGEPDEGLIHSLNRPMGRLASSYGGQFKALPLAGTTAATFREGGGGLHFAIVTPENNQDIVMALNSYARIIPVVLRVLPYVEGTGSAAQIRTFKWVNEVANVADFNFAPAP